MAHITTLTRAYNDLHNSQANTYSYSGSFETFKESEVKVKLNDTLLTYNSSPSDATQYSVNLTDKTIHVGGGNLTSGTLSIYPETDLGAPTLKAPYTAGSAITANDLTNNQKQTMRKLMEHEETKLDNTGGTMTGDLTIGEDQTIIFEGATDDGYETTITVADPTADRTITFPNVSGNVVTTGDTGTVTSTMLTNDTIVNADVNSSAAIAGTKISPNFGGQNIVTTGAATIGSTLAVTGAVDLNGGANIDNIQIGVTDDNEIDTASGNLTIDSAGGTVTIDDALAVTGGVSLNTTLGVTGTSTLADVTGGAVVTSGTSTSDTKVYSAKRAGEIFYGKDTVEEIQSGETWSAADDKVATTAAIDARIIDLVDDVGGFVPIANELSFPNANPDVNNGAGTLISIKALSTAYTSNSSGEISISNGTVGNSTVTITGAGNTVTYAQTLGMIVETTSTLNTYTFHRQTPDATTTTTVANNTTNINKVAAIDSDVTTVANIDSNVTTVAGDTTEINALAAKTTELGLLGTAAVVEDLGILGTADVVSDLNTLGTADVVADMNMLAVSDVISDMNTLAVTDVINDIDTVATNITNVNNVGGSIASVNTAAANLNSINNFGDLYQVDNNNPSTDGGGNQLSPGDLYFNTSANELKIWNGSSWQAGVTATGNFASVTGNTFTGDNRYNDNVKALFGTGSDFEIFFNGTNTSLYTGTGDITIQTAGDDIHLLANDDIQLQVAGGVETSVNSIGHGAVELYYDNSKKFETTSTGATLTGNLNIGDDSLAYFGDDNDLAVYYNNTSDRSIVASNGARLDLRSDSVHITSYDVGETMATFTDNGGVELYFNNEKTFETVSNGVTVSDTDTDVQINFVNNQGQAGVIYGDQTSTFGLLDGQGHWTVKGIKDGAVELYHDNSKKLETLSTGIEVTGFVKQNGMQLGSNQLRASGAGPMHITTANGNGTVDINVKDTHVEINGNLLPATDDTDNLGSDALRWAGLFLSGDLDMNDNDTIKLGTGDDLKIYHDGTHSYVKDDGTGDLRLQTQGGHVSIMYGSHNMALFQPSGFVKLYHNNAERLETTATGATLYGSALLPSPDGQYDLGNASNRFGDVYIKDSKKLLLGDGQDLEIYHDGTTSRIDSPSHPINVKTSFFGVYNWSGGEAQLTATQNGAVELFNNGDKKLETTSGGIYVTGDVNSSGQFYLADNKKLRIGGGQDLEIYHDGTKSYIDNNTGDLEIVTPSSKRIELQGNGGSSTLARYSSGGAVELFHDNSKKFETLSNGIEVSGHIYLADGNELRLGNPGSNGDLKIYHDGSNTKFQNSAGRIHIENSGGNIRTQTNHGFFIMSADGNTTHAEIDNEGLKFNGDTAGANALDDYEEGSFTPTVQDASSGGNTASGSSIQGKYTKVGSTVTVMICASGLSNSGMTGAHQMYITNLPFRMSGVSQVGVWTQLRYFNNISNTQFGTHWQINNNETIMRLQKLADNAGDAQQITYNHWMYSSGYFSFACSFSYITDQ